jgi:hypothetical protein
MVVCSCSIDSKKSMTALFASGLVSELIDGVAVEDLDWEDEDDASRMGVNDS